MKFRIGDKVKFLNDSGGGMVSEIVDQKIVKVMTNDGFELPVLARELIKSASDGNYEKEYSVTKKTISTSPEKQKVVETDYDSVFPENLPGNALKNLLLGFVPKGKDNAGISDIDLYLINDAAYGLVYLIGFQENVSWRYIKTGFLEPDTKLYLDTFNQSAISKIKTVHVQALFIGKGRYHPQQPLEKFIGLDNVRFYKESSFKENNYFHKKALILEVTENLTDKTDVSFGEELANAMMEKKQEQKKTDKSTLKQIETEEVDLHIEEITEDYAHLTPGEILDIQMKKFYSALDGGIINKAQKMVFIHGIGNGKLKFEVLKALDDKYPDLKYQDASFKEYGYGATMVYLA